MERQYLINSWCYWTPIPTLNTKTLQELQMLSSVTHNCQVTMIVINPCRCHDLCLCHSLFVMDLCQSLWSNVSKNRIVLNEEHPHVEGAGRRKEGLICESNMFSNIRRHSCIGRYCIFVHFASIRIRRIRRAPLLSAFPILQLVSSNAAAAWQYTTQMLCIVLQWQCVPGLCLEAAHRFPHMILIWLQSIPGPQAGAARPTVD